MRYYVGWDVGAWNCSKKSKSQDSLAVLTLREDRPVLAGKTVFRGSLREDINNLDRLHSLVNGRCGTAIAPDDEITIAIDTPLGLPAALKRLAEGGELPETIPAGYLNNPYLYRKTEVWVASRGFPPLSAVKDMIGSQCTKGMHLLRKLKMSVVDGQGGVWAGGKVTAIECYPATCKKAETKGYVCEGSPLARRLFDAIEGTRKLATVDQHDAVYCALVAYLFDRMRDKLIGPQGDPPSSEGWIWVPADAAGRQALKRKTP